MKALKILGLVLLLASPLLSQPPGPPISPGSSGGSGTVTNTDATCADTQIIRADGASNTATQCSVLTVADTTGNITGPAGGFTITGGTAATDDLILDGSAGTAGYVKVTQAGEIYVGSPGYVLIAGYAGVVIDGDAVLGSNNAGYFSRVGTDLGVVSFGDAASALLYGVAGGVIEQRHTTTQQTHRIYNTADDYPTTTNYERLSLTGVAGSSVNITAETAGTGGDNLDIVLTPAGTGKAKTGGLPIGQSSYGGLYITSDAGTTFVLDTDTGTFEQFPTFTAGTCSSDVTCSAATDDITMSAAGVYMAQFSCSFTAGNSDSHIAKLFKEGSSQNNCQFSRTMGAAAAVGSASFNCIVTAAANDSFDIRWNNATDGDDATLYYCNLTMTRIGS